MAEPSKPKRRAQRVKRRYNASLEAGGKMLQGIAMDFSEYGFFLQLRASLKVHTPVTIRLPIDPANPIVVQGRVSSMRADQVATTGLRGGGIGIELISPSEDYLKFIATTRK